MRLSLSLGAWIFLSWMKLASRSTKRTNATNSSTCLMDVTAMVGRDSELAYLDAIAVRARAGPAQLAVVEGEGSKR